MKKVIKDEQTKTSGSHVDRIPHATLSVLKDEAPDETGKHETGKRAKLRVYHPKMMIAYRAWFDPVNTII